MTVSCISCNFVLISSLSASLAISISWEKLSSAFVAAASISAIFSEILSSASVSAASEAPVASCVDMAAASNVSVFISCTRASS